MHNIRFFEREKKYINSSLFIVESLCLFRLFLHMVFFYILLVLPHLNCLSWQNPNYHRFFFIPCKKKNAQTFYNSIYCNSSRAFNGTLSVFSNALWQIFDMNIETKIFHPFFFLLLTEKKKHTENKIYIHIIIFDILSRPESEIVMEYLDDFKSVFFILYVYMFCHLIYFTFSAVIHTYKIY